MRFKVGDRVRIKSLDWYNENKDLIHGFVNLGNGICFYSHMSNYCGKTMTISEISGCYYRMAKCVYNNWTDEMIEGLVEEETYDFLETDIYKPDKKPSLNDFMDILNNEVKLPDGYIFKDENGNVINATKIVLEKQKKEYPKTYDECCHVLQTAFVCDVRLHKGKYYDIFRALAKLIVCRDAYWKIAGEEMGLGKPWELSIGIPIYYIYYNRTLGTIKKDYADDIQGNVVLAFPTAFLRDAFYENFKELIEQCKELL